MKTVIQQSAVRPAPVAIELRLACRSVVAAVLLAAMLTGCASDDHRQTQKEQAVKQWNGARAGIMHNLARDQYEAGNFDQARKTVDEALAIESSNVALLVLSARIALEQNALELAKKQLDEVLVADAINAEALYLSGIVAQRWQRNEEALALYTRAADAQPTEVAYLLARVETLVLLDNPERALSTLLEKVVYFEHSPAVRDAAGQLLYRAGRYVEAIEMLRAATILSADDGLIREHLARAQLAGEDYRGCLESLSRLSASPLATDRPDLKLMAGECLLQLKQFVEARMTFEEVANGQPSLMPAWLGVAKASVAVGDLRRAESASRKAVALSPESADVYLTLGYVLMQQRKPDKAVTALRTAASLDATDSVSLCLIGQIYAENDLPEEALAWYGRALKVNPADPLARELMATASTE